MNALEIGRAILAARGIDPHAPVADDPPFNPAEWRTTNTHIALNRTIDARFRDAETDHPAVVAWTNRYLANPAATPALLIAGPTGVGKSHQAHGALRRIALNRAAANQPFTWRITSHPALNDRLRPKPDGAHAYALDPYLTADLVLFDDLGAGKHTDWTEDAIYRLVDYRWAQQLPTIYSTNLTASQLEASVGARVVSRIADATRVAITGADRRWGQAR